ncbi:hypothetical protein A8135_09900 [Legionella jamestowniensis]|uniref:Uncharacterized protein n=1 Tax=Legionella jamestowniensis TaxID=455 RepID=A0ABX2Y1D4_9GAMM|nr:hypothetical protein A8135_09900 [Legionella jamestowniensis]
MLKQFLKDAQLSLTERPVVLIANALLGGFNGLVYTLIASDVVNFLNSSEIEEFIKDQAGQFNCTVEDDYSIYFSEICCESPISKKALILAAKIYENSTLYPSPLSTWSIARNVCIGSLIGFALGVDKAKQLGLSNNPNRFNFSSHPHTYTSSEELTPTRIRP